MMGVASSLILSHRSVDLSILGIDFVVTLEREVGWAALDEHSLSMTRASLLELPSLLVSNLLNQGGKDRLVMLAEAVKSSSEAYQLFKSAVFKSLSSREDRLPLISRSWARGFVGQTDDLPTSDQQSPATASDAAFERLALVLMNSWESRLEGERSAYSFSIIRDVLRTGFNLHLGGEPGMEARFDPAIHEGQAHLEDGDPVRLLRPWIELRLGGDLQILIRALVEKA
jgi:hypothetical protein